MEIRKAIFILTILLSSVSLFAQQKCNCEESFKWVKETFEKNDAGFEYAIQQKGKAVYDKHNDTILAKIKKATTKEKCAEIMHEWLLFFRKGHLSVSPINTKPTTDNANTNNSSQTLSILKKQIKEHLSNNYIASFEGIWTWRPGSDTICIIKENDGYTGMASSNKAWRLKIKKDSSGRFYIGNYLLQNFDKAEFIGKNMLKLGTTYLNRIYPKFQDNDTIAFYVNEITATKPFIQKLSSKTVLFRIPTFNGTQKEVIDSVIAINNNLLKSTENLIIDIRDNGGGKDDSYDNIVPLLYTNPIRITNVEFLSTPLNNKVTEDELSEPNLSESDKNKLHEELRKLNDNPGKFVNLDSGRIVDIQKLDTVFPFPKNVAIIINQNNVSSAEQFLLAAKQSKKVKLYGVTTMGVLDISNMYFVNSPNNQFKLGYCLSKSYRIPDMAIDGKGIMPDYYIDKSIPNTQWLSFVQNILEN